MKTNSFLFLILVSGLAALAFGAGGIVAFTVSVTAAIVGLTCNDYARRSAPVRFGPAA